MNAEKNVLFVEYGKRLTVIFVLNKNIVTSRKIWKKFTHDCKIQKFCIIKYIKKYKSFAFFWIEKLHDFAAFNHS